MLFHKSGMLFHNEINNELSDIRIVINQTNMFYSISWQQYLETIGAVLVMYYLVVLVMYYRKELLSFFFQSFRKRKQHTGQTLTATNSPDVQTTVLSTSVHELMTELSELLSKAEKQQYHKEELLTALQMKLRSYSNIRGTKFQHLIAEQITTESKACCNIILDDVELELLWRK